MESSKPKQAKRKSGETSEPTKKSRKSEVTRFKSVKDRERQFRVSETERNEDLLEESEIDSLALRALVVEQYS